MSGKQNKKHKKEMEIMTAKNLELHLDIQEMLKVMIAQRDLIKKLEDKSLL